MQRLVKITDDGCCYTVNDNLTIDQALDKIIQSYKVEESMSELKAQFENADYHSIAEAKKFYRRKVGYNYSGGSADDKFKISYFEFGNVVDLAGLLLLQMVLI